MNWKITERQILVVNFERIHLMRMASWNISARRHIDVHSQYSNCECQTFVQRK